MSSLEVVVLGNADARGNAVTAEVKRLPNV